MFALDIPWMDPRDHFKLTKLAMERISLDQVNCRATELLQYVTTWCTNKIANPPACGVPGRSVACFISAPTHLMAAPSAHPCNEHGD